MVDLPRLLIYDIVHFEVIFIVLWNCDQLLRFHEILLPRFQDIHVGKENFDIRFMCIRRELIEPRNEAIKVLSHLRRTFFKAVVRLPFTWYVICR